MNVYNAFNKLNLAPFTFQSQSTTVAYGNTSCTGTPPVCVPIANPNFGIATLGLSGRVVELEGRYVF